MFKLLKIFRLLKLSDQLKNNKNVKNILSKFSFSQQISEFLNFTLIIILFTHITGCFWFFLSKIVEHENWLQYFNLHGKETIFDQYMLSFYWAISTICTVGFGDVIPINVVEYIFNIIWIGVGVGFYSYTIGSLSAMLRISNAKKSIISSRFAYL